MTKADDNKNERVIPLKEDPPPKKGRTRPGYLVGSVTLSLHTLEANKMVKGKLVPGRQRRNRIGLKSFSRGYIAVADRELRIRINEIIDDMHERFSLLQDQINQHKQHQIIKIDDYVSSAPREIPLRLSTAGMRAAHLLTVYDKTVLDIHRLYLTGAYSHDQRNKMLRQALGYVRTAFESPFWQRKDVVAITKPTSSDTSSEKPSKNHV